MEIEIWKTSAEFKEIEVSNLGQIRLAESKKILKQRISQGCSYISFRINNDQFGRRVKIMIASVFLEPTNRTHVKCKDGNELNVAASNLEYKSNRKPYILTRPKLIPDYAWIETIKKQEIENNKKRFTL